jgi:hypothetical protein
MQTEAAGSSEMLLCSEKSTQNHIPKDSNLLSLLKIYRVIQEERAIFWEVTVSVIARIKCLYERVSNSEWASRQSFLNLYV